MFRHACVPPLCRLGLEGIRSAVERQDVPGVVALITDRTGVIYQGAFGVADVSTGRPVAADSLFRIASMTKAVTSAALMQLIEQGRIGLDDPAEKSLPELAGQRCYSSFVTLSSVKLERAERLFVEPA